MSCEAVRELFGEKFPLNHLKNFNDLLHQNTSLTLQFKAQKFRMVEVAGVEPASFSKSTKASTYVAPCDCPE